MVVAVEIEGDLALEVFFEADVGPFREFFGALGVHHMSAARHGFNKERLGLRRFRGAQHQSVLRAEGRVREGALGAEPEFAHGVD